MMQTSDHFSERDWEFIRSVRALLTSEHEQSDVVALLEDFSTGPINGLVVDLRVQLAALFGLAASERVDWRARPDLAATGQADRVRLFVALIDSISTDGPFLMPDRLFEPHRIAIELDGRSISVRELRSKDWDYAVFESVDAPGNCFVEFVVGAHAVSTVTKQLSATDSAAIATLDDAALDRLVDTYR